MIDLVFTEPEFGTDPPVKQIIKDEGIDVDPGTVGVILQKGKLTIRVLDESLTETEITSLEDAIEAAYDDTNRLARKSHANIRGFVASQRARERAPGLDGGVGIGDLGQDD